MMWLTGAGLWIRTIFTRILACQTTWSPYVNVKPLSDVSGSLWCVQETLGNIYDHQSDKIYNIFVESNNYYLLKGNSSFSKSNTAYNEAAQTIVSFKKWAFQSAARLCFLKQIRKWSFPSLPLQQHRPCKEAILKEGSRGCLSCGWLTIDLMGPSSFRTNVTLNSQMLDTN